MQVRDRTPKSAPDMISVSASLVPEHPSHDTHNTGSRSRAPAPSGTILSAPCAVNLSRQTSPSAAAPAARTFFDPWNSSFTGHQRAENRLSGSTSWRVSRNLKLGEQYKGGRSGGGKRVADTVGAGSENFGKDGRKANGGWENGAAGLRTGGQKSLAELWGASKAGKSRPQEKSVDTGDTLKEVAPSYTDEDLHHEEDADADHHNNQVEPPSNPPEKQIFAGLCFYVNGSTAPLVSDHKLKQLLAAHGARHSIALRKRSVTHIILSMANVRGGVGGGLASSKIQKEIARTGGKAVKFITAEWVLESIAANRCLPESRFSPLRLTPTTQNSVFDMLHGNTAANSKPEYG